LRVLSYATNHSKGDKVNLIEKLLRPFREKTDREIAARQLADAKRLLLSHQAQAEYHTQMCLYNDKLIRRLTAYMGETK